MRRFLRVLTVTVVALFVLGASVVPAFAASPSATRLVTTTRYIRPNANVPVFGIDLIAGSCPSFTQILIDFKQVTGGGTFNIDDLEADTSGTDGGIELWKDSGTTPDAFDSDDDPIPTRFAWTAVGADWQAKLTIDPAATLPATEQGLYTFFLTIRASAPPLGISNGDDFTVTLPANAFTTGDGLGCLLSPTPDITPVTTSTIIADTDPPDVILFTPPSTQTANFSWKISEPVVGVGQDSVALRRHGTTVDVPVSVSYDAATNTIVADPASSLTAGQEYDAILLPDGPGSITDRAGNELDDIPRPFRAATNVSELAPGVAYRWRNLANSSTYGGSYVVNNTPGASIAYTFTGTSIAWYTVRDPYQGIAAVSLDGRSFGSVNNYSSTTRYKTGKSFSGLAAGTHTITIRVTGTKGSSAAKDVRVSVDAFRSGGSTNVTPSLSYRWAAVGASGADGGTYRKARFSGTEMSFVFSGTSIAWRTVRGPSMGQGYVYIDGTLKGLFDNYSSTTSYKYMRAFLNLPAGTHTIKIKVASTRNSKATDRNIAIDGFVIG